MLEVIDRDPKAAFRRLGLSAGRITEAVKSWDELRSSRALHLLLAPHGLAWLVARIEKHYGSRAHRIVRERPYELTSVFGDRVPHRRHDRPLASTSRPTHPGERERRCCTS